MLWPALVAVSSSFGSELAWSCKLVEYMTLYSTDQLFMLLLGIVFDVIRVHIVDVIIKVGGAKLSWVLWPRPLPTKHFQKLATMCSYI